MERARARTVAAGAAAVAGVGVVGRARQIGSVERVGAAGGPQARVLAFVRLRPVRGP